MLKYADPTDEYIERRFIKVKTAHCCILYVGRRKTPNMLFTKCSSPLGDMLTDNGLRIDGWLKNARDGNATLLDGYTSGRGTVIIERANRQRKTARRIQVTIVKKEHNGMSYYVQTVRLD